MDALSVQTNSLLRITAKNNLKDTGQKDICDSLLNALHTMLFNSQNVIDYLSVEGIDSIILLLEHCPKDEKYIAIRESCLECINLLCRNKKYVMMFAESKDMVYIENLIQNLTEDYTLRAAALQIIDFMLGTYNEKVVALIEKLGIGTLES